MTSCEPHALGCGADRGFAAGQRAAALLTLQSLGYVESKGRLFSLSPQVLTLARAYLASSPVRGWRRAFSKKSARASANPVLFRFSMTRR